MLSGHPCITIPRYVGTCDAVIEQIPHIVLWGTVHFAAPFVNKVLYSIKILTVYNFTVITIYCNNMRDRIAYRRNEGESVERTVSNQQYCAIYSNKKVLVIQFSRSSDEDNGMVIQ